MDVMDQMKRLHAVGFREELLDRAVAMAGAQRLVYYALCDAVMSKGMSPEQALEAVENGWRSM